MIPVQYTDADFASDLYEVSVNVLPDHKDRARCISDDLCCNTPKEETINPLLFSMPHEDHVCFLLFGAFNDALSSWY
jgi:hypothetical protein